jgi:hypothetical protein
MARIISLLRKPFYFFESLYWPFRNSLSPLYKHKQFVSKQFFLDFRFTFVASFKKSELFKVILFSARAFDIGRAMRIGVG